jgi:predicted DNA-binding protein (MmcQ/YjbR family)
VTRDQVLELCLSLPGAVEDYPFGDEVAVFKVGGKMFALVMLAGEPGSVNLKCDPDWAVELREIYAAVRPGYHANKRHWNTVDLDGTVDEIDLQEMIEHSYKLIVGCLPRRERDRLPES